MTFTIWCLIGFVVSLLPLYSYVKCKNPYDDIDYQIMTFLCWIGLWPIVIVGYTFKFLFNQAVKAMKGIVNEP